MTNDQNDLTGGHTPLTPPPAPAGQASAGQVPSGQAPAPQGPPPAASEERVAEPAPARTSGTTAILVVTAVVGGIALLGSGGTAAFAAAGDLMSSSTPDSVQTVGVDGIDGVDLDVDGSSMRIEFGDVDEAELSLTNGRPSWTFERDGDELVVRSPESRWGWWFGNWFGDEEIAVLTLPESLRGEIDGDLTLDAGNLDVVGDFGELGIDVAAGALDVEGSARGLDIDMSAGRADVVLADVDTAVLGVSAGNLDVTLTGTAPSQTTIEVSAGSVDLTVPDESYSITQDVSAGSLDAKVDQTGGDRLTIDVSLSAGSVTIRPGN